MGDAGVSRFLGLSGLILGLTAVFVGKQAKIAVQQQEDAKRTRNAELIVNLSHRWDEIMRSLQLFSAYREDRLVGLVRELYGGQAKPEQRMQPSAPAVRLLQRVRRRLRSVQPVDEAPSNDFITLIELPTLIEAIGVLERDGSLALSAIDGLWGSTITSAWTTWRAAVIEMRELTATPTTYSNFERLAERLEALAAGR